MYYKSKKTILLVLTTLWNLPEKGLDAVGTNDKIFIGQQGESVTSEILEMPFSRNSNYLYKSTNSELKNDQDDVPFFPLDDITGTVIGLINRRPTLCGGYYRYDMKERMGYLASNECWSYEIDNDTWIEGPTMTEERQYGASVEINGTYYILGGKNSDYVPISSIERYKGNAWNEIGSMPYGVSSHCVAEINETHVLVTGGDYIQDGHPMDPPQHCSNVSYILNMTDFTFKMVEPFAKKLLKPWEVQCGHGCSRISGWNSGIIVVGAAINNENSKTSSVIEIFDPNTEQWHEGPKLDQDLTGATLVYYSNDVLLIGGNNINNDKALDTIYQLTDNNSWLRLNETLKYARYSFSAIPFK